MAKTTKWEKINIDPVNRKNFLMDLLTTNNYIYLVNFKWIIFQHKVDSNKSSCKSQSLCNNQDYALTKTKIELLHKYFSVVFTFFFFLFFSLSLIKRSKHNRSCDWNKKSKQFYKVTVFVPPAYCLTKIALKFSEQKIFWVLI